jgi:hypothetical protein
MKKHITSNKNFFVVAISAIAACLLTSGCASSKPNTLTASQLAQLTKTKTVLIAVDGVDGKQKEFFVSAFKEQLTINGLAPVTTNDKGVSHSEYDAAISLKCYYFDYGQFDLAQAKDLPFAFAPRSGRGVGKRICCRFELTHKGLGKLFDGQIQGTTKLQGRMDRAEFKEATSSPEAFSAFLERNAQQAFDADLKSSKGWLYVLNMRPNG